MTNLFIYSVSNNSSFLTSNWLIDNTYAASINLNRNFIQNFFYFFFSFNYNIINNFLVDLKILFKYLILIWEVCFINNLFFSYILDLYIKNSIYFNFTSYFSNLFYANGILIFIREPDLIFFYSNHHKINFFYSYTLNLINYEFINFFYSYESYFLKFFYTFFNYYIFYLFVIFLFFIFPLVGKTKLYTSFQMYIDFITLIPTIIEVSLEDFLFTFIFFKVLLVYFLISLFFLQKSPFLFFSYASLPFIFVVFGLILCCTFSKHLVSLFIFGSTVYTGINFSKFSQSILLGLVWDYVVIILMFFRFGVVLARLILVWMSFILVEILSYFFLEPIIDDSFFRITFLWKNNYAVYDYLSTSQSFDQCGETFLIFFITCFFYFCKLLLVSLQLFLFLFFGFFLIAMFTGYLDIEAHTLFFKKKYLINN